MFYFALSGGFLILAFGLRLLKMEDLIQFYFFFAGLFFLTLGIVMTVRHPFLAGIRRLVLTALFAVDSLMPVLLGSFALMMLAYGLSHVRKYGWTTRRKWGLIISAAMIATAAFYYVNRFFLHSVFVWRLMLAAGYVVGYFVLTFIGFLGLSLLYSLRRPGKNKDYILVLGAGLLPDGEIPSLLKSRLDKSLQCLEKQGSQARIIVSGGKGIDEPISEARAMKNYLVTKGVPSGRILEEDRSTNTYENFLYSRALIEAGKQPAKILFVTNNFHVFRSSLYAKRVNVQAEGIGAPTTWFFLPYVLVREFIALLVIYWRFNFAAALLVACYALASIFWL